MSKQVFIASIDWESYPKNQQELEDIGSELVYCLDEINATGCDAIGFEHYGDDE